MAARWSPNIRYPISPPPHPSFYLRSISDLHSKRENFGKICPKPPKSGHFCPNPFPTAGMSCHLILARPTSPKPPAQLLLRSQTPLLCYGESSSAAGFLGFPKLLTKFVLKPDDIYTRGTERLAARLAARGVGWREAAVAFSSNPSTSAHTSSK